MYSIGRSAHRIKARLLQGVKASRLEVLDVSGRAEATLADRIHTPGRYVVKWDGTGRRGRVSPGLYCVRFVAPGQMTMRKLAIIQ